MEDSSQEYILKVSQPLLFGEQSTIVSNVVRRLSQGILYIIDIAKKTNRKTTFVQFIFIIQIQPISIMIIVVNCMPAHEYFRQMTLQQFLCKKDKKCIPYRKMLSFLFGMRLVQQETEINKRDVFFSLRNYSIENWRR